MSTIRHKTTTASHPSARRRMVGGAGLLLIAWLSGCATTAGPRDSAGPSSELMAWVDVELAPYLIEQLSRHPRFKGEPVLLVATDGADVSPDIDALSASVRERLLDRLLQSKGVAVAWRPSAPPAEHHRRSPSPVCDIGYRAQYFIGIDIAALPGGGHRMSVRALDRRGEGWVTGFGKSWQGRLLPEERRALTRRRPDEYLRGLRGLPFEPSQMDLLAGYLARNLDCLLSEKGAGGSRIWMGTRPEASEADEQLRTLVERYLGRESQLTLADAPDQAEVTVSAELRPLHDGLHQAWLTARPGKVADHNVAIDTDGYIALAHSTEVPMLAADRNPRPLLSAPRWQDGAATDRVEFDLHADAYLFGIGVGAEAGLQRLAVGDCSGGGPGLRRFPGGEAHRLTPAGDLLQSVYILATDDREAAQRLQTRLRALPSACKDESSLQGDSKSAERWLSGLEQDLRALEPRVDWQGLRLPAGPTGIRSTASPGRWEPAP